ncbi:MAG: hypothetical protein JSR55_08780 [Proteobacteria bacterium]|nr:hypothetical protein [Pseudomonadota bacterium]
MSLQVVHSPAAAPSVALSSSSGFDYWGREGESLLIETNSRFFVRHELVLRSARDKGAPLALMVDGDELDVVSLIQRAIRDNTATLTLKKNDAIKITTIEVRERENIAIVLFRRSDPDASAPVFENLKTRKLWAANKGPDDAEAISAHLFIHLDAAAKPHPAHRAIIEEVPGLGRSYVQALLHDLLAENKYAYTDARGEQKETYTIPKFEGVSSETLGKALAGGGLEYIELVRAPDLKGLDTAGLVPNPERMRLTVKSDTKKGALAQLDKVRAWIGKEKNWQRMRVLVKTEDSRSKVVEIAREADAADVLFVRSELVMTKKPLAQCTDIINAELVAHAKNIFADAKGW